MAVANASSVRPPITGVSHIAVYASDRAVSDHFYVHDLGAMQGSDPESRARNRRVEIIHTIGM